MWPVIADLGIVKVTAWGVGLAISFVLGSFILWRRLHDDYDGEQLLSLWLWLVVVAWLGSGTWACGWFNVCLPPLVGIDGALLAGVGTLWWWSRKYKWSFWELLDVFAPVSLAVTILATLAWGPALWLATLVATLGIILATVLRGIYRDLHWYKSGRTGFVGIVALGWWGVVQLVIANFNVWGLYSLGWIVSLAIVLLYLRAGRKVSDDWSRLWPRKKV